MLNKTDVLIVGAGPTGTTLAIDLARRGLSVRIIEKNKTSFPGSRAKGIQPRTLEVFYDLGVIDELLKNGGLYPKMGIHLWRFTLPKTMFKNVNPTSAIPFPNTILIPQFRVDSILHKKLAEYDVKVEFDTTLTDFSQTADRVVAKVIKETKEEEITARFLVGADGGSSLVRKKLDIGFIGKTDEADRMLIVDANVRGLSRDYWHIWPTTSGFVGACPLPHSNLFQWMIKLKPDEEVPSNLNSITKRLQKAIKNPSVKLIDIQWTSVFRPNVRLASHYRKDRVFIAGDAAHVHTPAGAQGLNTGIQDAYNLGWKIAQTLAGAKDDSLLDSYEAERLPIAAGVLGLSSKKYEAIGKYSSASLKRGKDEQQLGITYQGSPIISTSCSVTKTLQAGDRVPNANFTTSEGKNITLFELLRGTQFTIIAYGSAARNELERLKWTKKGATLNRIFVNKDDERNQLGLKDTNLNFQKTFGLSDNALILIRPDKYIAHISTSNSLSTINQSVAKITGMKLD
ncbi:FAD-dependent oxidoreductase [Chondrinema litorale]|uniref:FAD-dependent oxidoreductase n=1 Tax=Chondrinema litorale TaxID=2994555 RepID=UPI0025436415|nr:FAD-dependent oxidoreductase [Chondrinema litorale]UZR98516.1 FAD-dependent oxidoreductase [Chondrinema litorale]